MVKKSILFVDKDYLDGIHPDDIRIGELHTNMGYRNGYRIAEELRETYRVTRADDFGRHILEFMIDRSNHGDPFNALLTHIPFGDKGDGDYKNTKETLVSIREQFKTLPIIAYSGINGSYYFSHGIDKLVDIGIVKTSDINKDISRIKEFLAEHLEMHNHQEP